MDKEDVKNTFAYTHPSYSWENEDPTKMVNDTLAVKVKRYQHGGALAVIITYGETGEKENVSTNFSYTNLGGDEFYADVNNCGDLIEAMEEAGIIKPTGKVMSTTYVDYPVYFLVGYAEYPELFEE